MTPIKKISLHLLLMFFCFNIYAQDILIMKDKTEYKVLIQNVLNDVILFKVWGENNSPDYTINKSEVFMIKYQNGKQETFDKPTISPQQPIPNYQVTSNNENSSSTINSPKNNKPIDLLITYFRRDKSIQRLKAKDLTKEQRKDKEFLKEYSKSLGDKSASIGLNLTSFKAQKIPSLTIIYDVCIAKNISISPGIGFAYIWEKSSYYKFSSYTTFIPIGAIYHFNQLLKIKKEKASLYSGFTLIPSFSFVNTTTDIPGSYSTNSNMEFNFSGGWRVGGSYNFSKSGRAGIFGDIIVGKGLPAVIIGIKLSRFRLK